MNGLESLSSVVIGICLVAQNLSIHSFDYVNHQKSQTIYQTLLCFISCFWSSYICFTVYEIWLLWMGDVSSVKNIYYESNKIFKDESFL